MASGGNHAWLASMAAMILTYYFCTDWRIATLGIAAGGLLARILFEFWGPAVPPMSTELLLTNTMVMAFCISMGLLLGLSSANLRREHLAHTLTTMGIMAHELRTPLATMALVGDAVRAAAAECEPDKARTLEQLSTRLHTLVRDAVASYPFRSLRERECVTIRVDSDFVFEGSRALFSQVIGNLVKNALRSLAAASSALQPGDFTIEVSTVHHRGFIVLADRGVGIDFEAQPRIFEPFFSTNRGTGHGLGLAFCHQVIHSAGGTIRVKSEPGKGAIFTIELPILY